MRVLVALDGEPFTNVITSFICNHRWMARTQFQLINVTEPRRGVDAWPDLKMHEADFKSRLQALKDCGSKIKASLPDTDYVCTVASGDPLEELLATCKQWKPDLLIIGSHGSDMLERKLLGSVSHSLLNQVDCATLVVKLPKSLLNEIAGSKKKNNKDFVATLSS